MEGGSVRARFSNAGPEITGSLILRPPRGRAELQVLRRNEAWIFRGTGHVDVPVPGVQPISLTLEHDGQHLTGRGQTGIQIRGLNGTLVVNLRDDRLSGEGQLQLNRGKARGALQLRLSEAMKLSGRGDIEYQLTESLIGRVGVILHEDQSVRVSGALEFPRPITLFRGFNSERELFRRSLDIPLLAVPLGPVSIGLVARITGAFGVSYGVGPGELRNLRVLTAFNPLEANTDLEIEGAAQLVIPAHAGLSLSIRGGIGVSAGVASVTGGLTATGAAELRGGFDARVDIAYRRGAFALDARAAILVSPVLRLGLSADVTAEAGAFGFTIEKRKEWRLAAFEWGSGLEFGLIAPIHYASGEPFRAPSLNDIQWKIPDIDVTRLIPDLIGRARGSEA